MYSHNGCVFRSVVWMIVVECSVNVDDIHFGKNFFSPSSFYVVSTGVPWSGDDNFEEYGRFVMIRKKSLMGIATGIGLFLV